MAPRIESEQAFVEDGSGYNATVFSYGYRFAASFVAGEIKVRGLNVSQYGRHGWKLSSAAKAARELVEARIAELGPDFMAKHRALYELDGAAA